MQSFVNISYLCSGIQLKESNVNHFKKIKEIEEIENNRRIKYHKLSNGLNEVIEMFNEYKKSNLIKKQE